MNIAIKVENVSKKYKLGQIGVTTLREELSRLSAKLKRKDDPALKIGQTPGKTFYALSDISFSVKKGERIGIIGKNGAGKSTLLKIISRITAPTTGSIGINGKIASMLEVGTGFHPELTGRENIYMNGAILGMTRKEIDEKCEKIIDFSECREFIDTPVKRYSSGMYVKLAFSVAAHLDSDILIMDEVLAVGDMAFQQKCIEKMDEISREDGKTILYVSHNMNTIRNLCDRCIVLDSGKIIFDGKTEKAIEVYLGTLKVASKINKVGTESKIKEHLLDGFAFETLELADREKARYKTGEKMRFFTTENVDKDISEMRFRAAISRPDGTAVTSFVTNDGIDIKKGENQKTEFTLDISALAPGRYNLIFGAYKGTKLDNPLYFDIIVRGKINFEITADEEFKAGNRWNHTKWGSIVGSPIEVKQI